MRGDNFSITAVLRLLILLLVLAWCFLIIKPFIIILVWAIIIGVSLYPVYHWLTLKIGEKRKRLVTIVFALLAVNMVIIPTYMVVVSLVKNTRITAEKLKTNTLRIPEPREDVKTWPFIGQDLYTEWASLSDNLENYIAEHKDFVLEGGRKLVSEFTGFLGALVAFVIAFLLALVLMYNARYSYDAALGFYNRLLGSEGEELVVMCRDTIRSVVKGILLVALIQSVFAFVGFKLMGFPASGLWALAVFVVGVIQIPGLLVFVPAIIVGYSIAEPTAATIFAIYMILISLSENVMKPIFLGKGLRTPMIVILVGAIGGLLLHGIIGLFVGPVVLAVMYQLYNYWVSAEKEA